MTLLDEDTYRRITGDTTVYSGTVLVDALSDAQAQTEGWLRRPVESESRTENVNAESAFNGDSTTAYLYPKATPVTAVPAGYTIVDPSTIAPATTHNGILTYTGGWTLPTAPYVVLALLAGVTRRVVVQRSNDAEPDVDPEGNVIPVVPPFDDDDPDPIYRNAVGYRRLSGTGSDG